MTEHETLTIAGASGVVGSRALAHLLEHQRTAKIIAIGRKALPLEHEKLVSKVADLQDEAAISAAMPDRVDIAVCALGTTMKKAGSKEAFRAVDYDAVIHFAKAALRKGARHFLVVTAIGSNSKSRAFYSKTKGEVEEALKSLGFETLTILRPSIIDDQGARPEYRFGEHLGLIVSRALFSFAGKTSRYAPITADTIGRALTGLAMNTKNAPGVRIVESDELHQLAS